MVIYGAYDYFGTNLYYLHVLEYKPKIPIAKVMYQNQIPSVATSSLG